MSEILAAIAKEYVINLRQSFTVKSNYEYVRACAVAAKRLKLSEEEVWIATTELAQSRQYNEVYIMAKKNAVKEAVEEVAPKKGAVKKTAAKPTPAVEVVEKVPRALKIPNEAVITVLAEGNPKRAGSASYERFELYKDGMTVGEYIEAGGKRADVQWDVDHEHISIE